PPLPSARGPVGAPFAAEGFDPREVFSAPPVLHGGQPESSEAPPGPPPPPPGQPPHPDHDAEDRTVLRLVGDYRYGTVFAALPEPEFDLPPHTLTLDTRPFVRRLGSSITVSSAEKYRIIGSLPRLTQ